MIGLPAGPVTSTAPAQAPAPVAMRTMIGMPMTEPSQQPRQPPSTAANVGKRTMIGMAGPLPVAAQPQVQAQQQALVPGHVAPPGSAHRTMLGMPPSEVQPAAPPVQQPVATPQGSAHRTMLGVAMPGIAPVYAPQGGSQPQPQAQQQGQTPASAHRTMLGVAMPGIAPVHPGSGAPPAQQPDQTAPSQGWYQAPQPPADLAGEPPPATSPRVVVPHPPFYRRIGFFIATFGVVIAVSVALFAIFWPTSAPIRAEVAIDDKGNDVLKLSCPTCPDGTVLSVDGSNKGTVSSRSAEVPLGRPLVVGDNRFQVAIDRPGSGRDETVQLTIPVAYRIKPDLTALQQAQPAIRIDVDAKPGTVVVIDGQAVTVGADGKGSRTVDVTAECTGPSAEVKTIDRALPYEVQGAGAKGKGTVAVKVGISPLTVQSPRANAVVGDSGFLVAGHTSPNGAVEIEGTKLTAGPDGRFSRKVQMNAAGVGEIRVRATAADKAPRTVVLKVKRVDDLEAEARSFGGKVSVADLFARTDDQKGKPIALDGEVFELRQQGFERVILLDVGSACEKSPCLVRLLDASTTDLPKGVKVRVFGYVTGAYSPPGGRVAPEVDVAFLLPSKGRSR